MFKIGSFSDELYKSMGQNLTSNHLEDKHGFSKLAKAADFLNSAATIFEQAGMTAEAEEVTEVLKSLANQLMASKK